MSRKNETISMIVKESFIAETVSIIGNFFVGSLLLLLISPFKTFLALIIMLPALISFRGNIGAPFVARTSRDLIIGVFSKKSWLENVLATYVLSIITAIFIGFLTILMNLLLYGELFLPIFLFILIPTLTNIMELSISIPCSTSLNYFVFNKGLNPNNIINPIMTTIDDFLIVLMFYFSIILLGVS